MEPLTTTLGRPVPPTFSQRATPLTPIAASTHSSAAQLQRWDQSFFNIPPTKRTPQQDANTKAMSVILDAERRAVRFSSPADSGVATSPSSLDASVCFDNSDAVMDSVMQTLQDNSDLYHHKINDALEFFYTAIKDKSGSISLAELTEILTLKRDVVFRVPGSDLSRMVNVNTLQPACDMIIVALSQYDR
ncbi:MAG: hypothetical protein O3A01_02870 [bacterium]|nr:hypothetical protein [bacterium]